MKKYKDKGRYIRPHNIQVGNKVLMEQKATKAQPPYDPKHYTVTEVHSMEIQAKQGKEVKRRHAQKWKKVDCYRPL